jgi:predicted dehydrogenase
MATMDKNGKLSIAVIGLGFGAEFVPIYLHHPKVGHVAICDPDRARLKEIGDKFGVEDRCDSYAQIIADKGIDAVHLVSPIPAHAAQAVAVLEAGKHCACTVPMATSLDDLRAIVAAQRAAQKNYFMAETSVYTREFLYVKDMAERGELGKIQFLRGAHYQDMENWPSYWLGLPPMHYATHAVSPLLALAGTRAERVHCFGSGSMRPELHEQYGNPYPIETAIFHLEGTDLAAEVTRSLFHTARLYTESFNVYGEKATFEWQQIEQDEPVLFKMGPLTDRRGRTISAEHVAIPDYAHLLPAEIGRFTRRGVYDESNPHLSFLQGGGHGGSHPHMVHEFISSIVEQRKPAIDALTAANWTAAGICAHQSAMQGGAEIEIPRFDNA